MTVYLEPVGNRARYETELREFIVTNVGRKYFEVGETLEDTRTIRFHLEDKSQATDYLADWKFYESKQAYLDDKEYVMLLREIRKAFDRWSRGDFTLQQLRDIAKIISPQATDSTESAQAE
jgi:hypothetical protein